VLCDRSRCGLEDRSVLGASLRGLRGHAAVSEAETVWLGPGRVRRGRAERSRSLRRN